MVSSASSSPSNCVSVQRSRSSRAVGCLDQVDWHEMAHVLTMFRLHDEVSDRPLDRVDDYPPKVSTNAVFATDLGPDREFRCLAHWRYSLYSCPVREPWPQVRLSEPSGVVSIATVILARGASDAPLRSRVRPLEKCPFPFATFIILDRSGLPATGAGMLIPKPPDITPPAPRTTFTHAGPRIWITGLGQPGTPQTPRCILASQESQQPCSDQGLWRLGPLACGDSPAVGTWTQARIS